ncbi:MAG TPA: response regulator [Chthoniobacteraceae bacterium]|nr:response regulator [Chthoniobacteraceae bacterium]
MTPPLPSSPAPVLEDEASFRLLFHQHPLPTWVVDNQTLRFMTVNEAAVQLYGYSREEFMEMTMDQIAEADENTAEPVRDEAALNPAPMTPWRHRRKDGTVLQVDSTWHEIPFRGHESVLVLTIDRTEQRRAEQRNREQARLIDLASDAILVRDLQHRIRSWNRGAERLYLWTADEAMGELAPQLFGVDMEAFLTAQVELLQNGEWKGQFTHRAKDEREVIVSSRWTLVRGDNGEPASVLVIDTDVTETKKLESQFLRAQRLESIGTLASGIAHDLNNILSPILMSVSLLRRDLKDPGAEKMLNIVETSAERGAGIVKQVLTFARGVEGERVLLQPKHLISELSKIMTQTFPRNVDIQTNLPTELWTVSGDATQLHQVLLNLCVNARDAMPQGGTLHVGAENVTVDEQLARMNPGAQLGPHVVLRVGDTGSGMSVETMDKIFDPFFTTKEVGKGTGLGLATVLGIVKGHGGFLSLQSEIGVGTTFRIYLPSSGDTTGAAKEEGPIEVKRGNGERVLVVDDEPPIREALVGTLESNGYRAFTAEDGSDALALYFQRKEEIDVVLTDLAMAQMDGIALVRSLRKVNPDVRVIVSSGHMQKDNMVVLNGLGVKSFLDKPYSADKLLRALREILHEPPRKR